MEYTKTLSKRWRKLFCDTIDYHEDMISNKTGNLLVDDIDEDVYVMVQDIVDFDKTMKFTRIEFTMLVMLIDYVAQMLIDVKDRSKDTIDFLRESELFMKRHKTFNNIHYEWETVKNEESLVNK